MILLTVSASDGAAGIIAYVITIAIVAAIPLSGALLVWLGTKRSLRLFHFEFGSPAAFAQKI